MMVGRANPSSACGGEGWRAWLWLARRYSFLAEFQFEARGLWRRGLRDVADDGCARTRGGFHLHVAAMQFDEGADEREAEAGAAGVA